MSPGPPRSESDPECVRREGTSSPRQPFLGAPWGVVPPPRCWKVWRPSVGKCVFRVAPCKNVLFPAVSLRQRKGPALTCPAAPFHASAATGCCIGSGGVSDASSRVTSPLSPPSAQGPVRRGSHLPSRPASRPPPCAGAPSVPLLRSGGSLSPVSARASSAVACF